MTRLLLRKWGWAPAVLALALTACSQRQGQAAASVQLVRKTFTLTPGSSQLKVGYLTGVLRGLRISERVDSRTGRVVWRPDLQGTLTLRNESTDQTARLIRGKLVYLDASGRAIPVPKIRGGTSFDFTPFDTRLAPGQRTTLAIDVPFPRAGLLPNALRGMRLDIRYLPTPYLQEAASVSVSLKG